MLFAHGFGCDQAMWRHVVPHFDERTTVLFDHVGFGASAKSSFDPNRYDSLERYADDALEIIEELDLHDVIFVGHSVSSMIGVIAANKAPERFAALVLVGPSPRYINDGDYIGGFSQQDIEELLDSLDSNYLGWSAAMAPVITDNPHRPEFGRELTESFCRVDPAIARHFARLTFLSDNRADLPSVSVPTLVIQCMHDAIAPRAVGEYVSEHIPQSQFDLLDVSGHCPNLSSPDETAAAIRRFVDQLDLGE